jgi:CheY-like chemotaxis protein
LEHTLSKAITVRREWPEVAATVVGDPTQLAQVVMNLCVNAHDAMPDGGVLTLNLAVTTLDARTVGNYPGAVPGRYLILSVADTGTGIPPAVQEKMFDPFFTTKPHGQGTGLGLSTVLGIVKSHGGFVNVYSEPDRGTKMCVYLPAADPPGGATGVSVVAGVGAGRGECVLVVDDEPAILVMARATLEGHGYRVVSARGGAEGIAAFRKHQPDVRLVLVDMMMPEVDGPAVMAAIRQASTDVPILAASGLRPTGRFADAVSAAAARFIPKPYSDDDLLTAIGERLARR